MKGDTMLAYSHSTRYQVRRYCCLWRLGIHIDMTARRVLRTRNRRYH